MRNDTFSRTRYRKAEADKIRIAPRNEQLGYRKDIDGLRAIAVIAVVFYHAHLKIFAGGFVGVDVFFVISGYLIGSHIYKEICEDRFSLLRFYQRRARRILPALLFVMLFCYAAAVVFLSPLELALFGRSAFATLISGSNIVQWRWASDYFGPKTSQNPLAMTWTLSVEEQFYIVVPLLLLLLSKAAKKYSSKRWDMRTILFWAIFCLTIVSFLLCTLTTSQNRLAVFYLIQFRAWELAIGVLLTLHEARVERQHRVRLFRISMAENFRGWLGLSLILFAVFGFASGLPFPGPAALIPTLGAALIISAPNATCNVIFLSSRPLLFIGLISYSWYLWHWPLMSFASIVSLKPLSVTYVVLAFISFPVAWLSYQFVEKPYRQSQTEPALLLVRYGIVVILFAFTAFLMTHSKGFPRRYPDATMQERLQAETSESCFGDSVPNTSAACLPKPDGRSAVALWGDSHAAALYPALHALSSGSICGCLTSHTRHVHHSWA